VVEVLIKGGPVMIPLLLCSIIALAISFERIYYLLRSSSDPVKALQAVTLAVEHKRVTDAVAVVERFRGPIGALAAAGLTAYGKEKADMEQAIRAAGEREVGKMEHRLSILSMIITVAPLLGILGTVTGIIKSFGVLARSPQLLDAAALSAGIAEALLTTAAGLIIAIFTLVLYTYITGIIDRRIAEMNDFSSELLEILAAEVRGSEVRAQRA